MTSHVCAVRRALDFALDLRAIGEINHVGINSRREDEQSNQRGDRPHDGIVGHKAPWGNSPLVYNPSQMPESEGTWTDRRLLEWTTPDFERKGVDSPRLSAAELLLAHSVLAVPRIKL